MKAPAKASSLRAGPQVRAAPAPILAIGSGKGGVGKTWLSTTLATYWGRAGLRTLLVDGDLGLANADVQLGVRPEADLASVLRGWIDLDAAVTPVLGGPGKAGGFDLLPGHSGSGALAALPLEEVHAIALGVSDLARRYDAVVLDLSAGVDPTTIRLARAADRVIVVTTEEPTALTDAYAFFKVLRTHAPQTPTPMVVVNMAERPETGRRTFQKLAKACDHYLAVKPALAAVIHRDPAVPDCIRAQTALPLRNPLCQAAQDVQRLSELLARR